MSTKTPYRSDPEAMKAAKDAHPDMVLVDTCLTTWSTLIRHTAVEAACAGCAWESLFKPAIRAAMGEEYSPEQDAVDFHVLHRLWAMDPAGGCHIDPRLWDVAIGLLPGVSASVRGDWAEHHLEEAYLARQEHDVEAVASTRDWDRLVVPIRDHDHLSREEIRERIRAARPWAGAPLVFYRNGEKWEAGQ